jgi:ribonuclease-3
MSTSRQDGPESGLERLEERFGHRFSDRALLERALVHRSASAETGAGDNETLEFLGDAVLDLAVSELLIRRHPEFDEGQLSRLRAAMVNARYLAQLARELDIGAFLKLGKGEQKSGGRDKESILSAAYEAVLGAVFFDGGYRAATRAVERQLGRAVDEARLHGLDPKTELQELLRQTAAAEPDYRVASVEGPDHARSYEVEVHVAGATVGRGKGPSRKSAEQEAARRAYATLKAKRP